MDNTTAVFQCPATAYVRVAARQRLLRQAWLPAALLTALAVAAFYDVRFVYVLLMVLFALYPMALTTAWLAMTGKPEFVMASRPQRWTFGSGAAPALRIEFFKFDCDTNNPETPVADAELAASSIIRIERLKAYIAIWSKHPDTPLLLIPSHLFPFPETTGTTIRK